MKTDILPLWKRLRHKLGLGDCGCYHFLHPKLPMLWQNAYPPKVLALLGSRAAHAPSSIQAIYIVTQGPQTLCDLWAAWSHNLRVPQLQLCKPLCAHTRQPLKDGHAHSMLSSPHKLLQVGVCFFLSLKFLKWDLLCVSWSVLTPSNFSRVNFCKVEGREN